MNNLHYQNLVFFDLETSGLDVNEHEIIQIGAVDAITNEKFMRRIDFDIDKADKACLEINSFDEQLWDETAVPIEQAILDFSDFLSKRATLERTTMKGNTYKVAALGGYNIVAFDKPFILKAFEKANVFFPADYRMFDVYLLALWLYPGYEKYGLETMCERLNIKAKFHDALQDAFATKRLAKKILKDIGMFGGLDWK